MRFGAWLWWLADHWHDVWPWLALLVAVPLGLLVADWVFDLLGEWM